MPLMQSAPGAVTRIDGREYFYFVGTGYLGLQGHPELIRAARETVEQYGIGSANSRTAFGTTSPVLQVEHAAAKFLGLDDAFYFASGWMGNGILLGSLDGRCSTAFIDEHSHYSLFEAAQRSGRPPIGFRHRDADDLREKLKRHLAAGDLPVVLSDGVFAATGAMAPARAYCEVLQQYPGSTLLLDDAHGLAVLGENGRGTYEYFGLWSEVSVSPRPGTDIHHSSFSIQHSLPPPCPALLFSTTLSKAIGGFGGIVAGNREFIGRLKSHSPYVGGASAPPAMVAAATAKALELVAADPDMRTRLHVNVRRLKDGLRRLGFDVDDTPVPIVCLKLGTAANMQRIQRELMAQGIAVAYMAAYSGLGPEGGLRMAVFATHSEEMITRLLEALRRLA